MYVRMIHRLYCCSNINFLTSLWADHNLKCVRQIVLGTNDAQVKKNTWSLTSIAFVTFERKSSCDLHSPITSRGTPVSPIKNVEGITTTGSGYNLVKDNERSFFFKL